MVHLRQDKKLPASLLRKIFNSGFAARKRGAGVAVTPPAMLGNRHIMGLFLDLQNRLRNSGIWIFGALLMVYFAFHAVNGERGLLKYLYLRQEIAEAEKIARNYNLQKIKLEEKVKHLSNASLDLDLLEERARVVLNFAAADEFIILDESEEK